MSFKSFLKKIIGNRNPNKLVDDFVAGGPDSVDAKIIAKNYDALNGTDSKLTKLLKNRDARTIIARSIALHNVSLVDNETHAQFVVGELSAMDHDENKKSVLVSLLTHLDRRKEVNANKINNNTPVWQSDLLRQTVNFVRQEANYSINSNVSRNLEQREKDRARFDSAVGRLPELISSCDRYLTVSDRQQYKAVMTASAAKQNEVLVKPHDGGQENFFEEEGNTESRIANAILNPRRKALIKEHGQSAGRVD